MRSDGHFSESANIQVGNLAEARAPYNINRLTLVAGEAAIKENDYYMENCKKIIATRDYTTEELTKLGFDVIDSKANFVFLGWYSDAECTKKSNCMRDLSMLR